MLTGDEVPPLPPALLAKYATSGPRYTSYPTAPTWTTAFDEHAFADALHVAGARGAPLALYAHFPYCATKCFYCGCNALTTSRAETVDRYLDDLEREVDLIVEALGRSHPVAEMHWGGGTPNLLSEAQLTRAFRLFDDRFRIVDAAELSVEADPRVVTPSQLRTLRSLGFSRISFGVQDLDQGVQQAIGRLQSPALVRDVCAAARDVGFAGLNIDLIYGLPRQTEATFERTIEQALELAPDRVACFGYAHMPAQRVHQQVIDEAELPGASTRAALFQLAVHHFTGARYAWLGLDHFARRNDPLAIAQREGRLHRNFMGYTTMSAADLVGVGMSAISEVGGCFAQNAHRIDAWRARVAAKRMATIRGHRLDHDDHARQNAIQHLMCNLELPYDAVPPGMDDLRARFASFEADGLVVFECDRLAVTPLGRFFLRNMAMEFDAYLPAQAAEGRFSGTV